jgi:pilus assembly protein CpaE
VNGPARISVLIADGDAQFLTQLEGWLSTEPTLDVVGSVADGDAAVSLARRAKPDVVLMDMAIPGRSGVDATEMITTLLPSTGVIMIAQDGAPDSLRKAMIAGARQFILRQTTKPELLRIIREIHQSTVARRVLGSPGPESAPGRPSTPLAEGGPSREGRVIAVFSPKGGVGTTTVAVNLAAALCKEHQLRVALVDGSLPFGDIAVFLDLVPHRSIMDLVVSPEQIDDEFVNGALTSHQSSGLKVLLAPPRPEMAEMVTAEQIRRTIGLLKHSYDYTIVDTWSCLDERVLTVLELADHIALCFTLDLPAIKSSRIFLEVTELLRFPADKIIPVLVKSTGTQGIEVRDVEATLGRSIPAQIGHDARLASRCINEGSPVVLAHPGAAMAGDFRRLTAHIAGDPENPVLEPGTRSRKVGRFGLFTKS